MCPAQITLVLRRDFATGRCLVHVSSHRARHNHALSDGLYREHPRVRKVTDPAVLRTVEALQQAEVAPAKILQYVRDSTDKQVLPRDVHNLLAMLRKGGSPPTNASVSTAPAFRLRESGAMTTGPPTSTSTLAPSTRVATCTATTAATTSAAAQLAPATQVAVTPQPSGQYAKFLTAFDVAKQLSEVLASMSAERFEHGLAELGMFLRIAESGRQPIVTTREAVKYVQRQAVQEAVLGVPQPASASDSRSASSNAASNSNEPAAEVIGPSTVNDDVHSRVNSEESEQEREL